MCMYKSLNNQPCQARQTLVNINFTQRPSYSFAVSVNKCWGEVAIPLMIHTIEYALQKK